MALIAADLERVRRRNNLQRRAPERTLYRTVTIPAGTASVDTGAVFPVRTGALVLATAIHITGGSAAGIVWEFGDNTTGAKLGISGGSLFLAAGAASGDAGVDLEIEADAFAASGYRASLVVELNPGRGLAIVTINGSRAGRVVSPDPWASWASSNAGAVGAAHAGSASTQRGQAINGAPSQFALTAPLSVCMGQSL